MKMVPVRTQSVPISGQSRISLLAMKCTGRSASSARMSMKLMWFITTSSPGRGALEPSGAGSTCMRSPQAASICLDQPRFTLRRASSPISG